jgi:ProP effector
MRKQEPHPRTVMINKKQKYQSKKTRNEALIWLAKTFPCAFDNSMRIQPLRLGIMADVLAYEDKAAADGISKSKLREAVVIFARRIDYLTCLKAREMRIDLEGNSVGPVTEEEAARAAEKIKKRIEKSVKNARKNLSIKSKSAGTLKYSDNKPLPSEDIDDWEGEATGGGYHATSTVSSPSVMIKHKPSRVYDLDAVARLKEKLGLSRKSGIEQETTE